MLFAVRMRRGGDGKCSTFLFGDEPVKRNERLNSAREYQKIWGLVRLRNMYGNQEMTLLWPGAGRGI